MPCRKPLPGGCRLHPAAHGAGLLSPSPTALATRPTLGRIVLVGLLSVLTVAFSFSVSSPAGSATPMPATTASYYEDGVDAATLLAQGEAAGQADTSGLVILDFGRPAFNGYTSGTMDFGGNFVSLASVTSATLSYIQGYFATAPADLHLVVAIGTNNSCGTGQPCGSTVCGCTFEPPSFAAWGAQQAAAVEETQAEANSLSRGSGYTDVVTVVAGDDAEPAFDPGYQNTYDLLDGYANAVRGFEPSMIDFGSADHGYWSNDQLLQIVDGFRPDIAVPEIYFNADVSSWTSLVSYAKSRGRPLNIFGVLTNAPNGDSPRIGYQSLLNAIEPITGQTAIRWSSAISH